MTKLEKLISELCPNGIEYKNLEECCEILDTKRKPISKNARQFGEYPYYGANGIQDYVSDYIFEGTFILIGEDGSVITKNGNPVVNWANGKIWVNNHAHILKEKNMNLRFLYHYIQTIDITDLIHGNIPKLTQSDLRNIKIPVLPLPIQVEIVKILDKFINLTNNITSELSTELESRKKQYEYYQYKVLSSYSNCNYKKIFLGDIGKVCMCRRIMKDQTSPSGDVPFYKIGTFGKKTDSYISRDLFNKYKSKYSYPKKGDILISCSGTIGKTVVFDGNDSYFQDSNIVWLDNNEKIVTNKYLYFAYKLMPFKISTGGTIARLYNEGIEKAEIKVPSLEIQKHVVHMLEKYERTIDDITNNLLKEIDLQKKKYEFYRNKLLSFNREEV